MITLASFFLILALISKPFFVRIAFKKPLVVWGIWVIYSFLNTLILGYGEDLPIYSIFTLLFVSYLFMLTISYSSIKDQKRLSNILIVGMYISILIVLLFDNETRNDRIGAGINSNTLGLMSVVLIMLLYLKYFYKKITFLIFLGYSVIPVITIIITGSKTAFGGLLMLTLSHIYINRSKNTLKAIVKFSFSVFLVSIPLYYLINNTLLGERIKNTTEAKEKLNIDTGNVFLDKFGDRGIYYYYGWQVFKEKPIFGVGLANYRDYTNERYGLHTEYMIQLTELGIVGFVLFLSFYFFIFKYLFKLKNKIKRRKDIEIHGLFIVIILIMITATRMYNQWYLFSIVGIVIGFVSKEKYKSGRIKKIIQAINRNELLHKS